MGTDDDSPGRDRALEVLAAHGGVARAKELKAAGLSAATIARLTDDGTLTRIGRGVYTVLETMLRHMELVVLTRHIPDAIVCMESAAAIWELTDEVPAQIHLARARGRWVPSPDEWPDVRVHSFGRDSFELGRVQLFAVTPEEIDDSGERVADVVEDDSLTVEIVHPRSFAGHTYLEPLDPEMGAAPDAPVPGWVMDRLTPVTVPIYSPERTICDLYRLRAEVGRNVAHTALRTYLAQPGAAPGRVMKMARRLRIAGVVREAIETMTA